MAGTLLDRSIIRVSGPDAQRLLNDTLTGRIASPMGLEGRWFALLSPQGKVLAEGLATEADGAFWLDVHPGVAANFLKRMTMYRLRAKVELADVTGTTAVWWSDGALPPSTSWLISYSDRRSPALGRRYLLPRNETEAFAANPDAYERARIATGIAELGSEFGAEEAFAHDIGLDILDGIDFDKGCYVGQEVVSRMKHRGTARRRPIIVRGIADAAPGTAVIVDGRDSGTIGRVVDGAAVAIVRLDRFTPDSVVTVGGAPVSLAIPAWASYAFGETTPDEPAASMV